MALANYLPTTCKVIPGNRNIIYIAPTRSITALAETSGEISTLTAANDVFKQVRADFDSVQYTDDGTFKTSGGYTQNLVCRLANASPKDLNALVDELVAAVACGLEIVWVDNGSNVLLAGTSVAAKEGSSRPFNQLQVTYDSGTTLTDENTQAATLTFSRVSAVRPIPLDATLKGAVLGGTAAWIDIPT
jgi:RNAse (barnase) inhibitor barstar